MERRQRKLHVVLLKFTVRDDPCNGAKLDSLEYIPSSPVCIKLSNCRMNVPDLVNNGM